MGILRAIWAWLRSWFVRPAMPVQPLTTVHAEELPEVPDPAAVYVLGEGDYHWFVALVCPCGCRATLHMSLLPDAEPRWKLIEHKDGTISLQPSVWRTVGCRSHFFLRHGRIQWCPKYREL